MATTDARFPAGQLPEVNTWVRMASAQSSRRWVNAVPALVSQVSSVLVPGAPKPEVRVNVLAPNVLALRHNFQAEAYREFKDLPLADVRPYTGHDQSKLQSLLLAAVRHKSRLAAAKGKGRVQRDGEAEPQAALHRGAMAPPSSRAPSKRTLHRKVPAPPQAQAPSPSKRKLVDEEMDTTRENVAKFFKRCARKSAQEDAQVAETQVDGSQVGPGSAGAGAPPASEREAEVHAHAATGGGELEEVQPAAPKAHPGRALVHNVTPLDPELPRVRGADDSAASAETASAGEAEVHAHAATGGGELGEVQPATPKAHPRRALVHNVTPLDPELPRVRGADDSAASAEKVRADLKAEVLPSPKVVLQAPMPKERFLELTRLTSRAFRAAPGAESEGILSKRAIAEMMEEAGANLVPGELDYALKHLDADNKLVLSDELVFMV